MIELRFSFDSVFNRLQADGYAQQDVLWSQSIRPPRDPADFALELAFVICNSGMRSTTARGIFASVSTALVQGKSAASVFGHPGKAQAIDWIWKERELLLADYRAAGDKIAFLGNLPWIGPITKYHAAKNFGLPVVKPDVHLQRLADVHDTTPEELCAQLAKQTGYKLVTIDTLLWRACATGILDSRTGMMTKGDT